MPTFFAVYYIDSPELFKQTYPNLDTYCVILGKKCSIGSYNMYNSVCF